MKVQQVALGQSFVVLGDEGDGLIYTVTPEGIFGRLVDGRSTPRLTKTDFCGSVVQLVEPHPQREKAHV